jgi:nicotinate dehydrogenase subunit B
VPDEVDIHIIDRPGTPFLGTGEAAQGPTAAAIANGVADAVGVRMRDIPLTSTRVKAAIGV